MATKEYMKIYNQRPERKAKKREYNQREEVKLRIKEVMNSPKNKKKRKAYMKVYNQTEKRKEKKREYNQQPEIKEKMKLIRDLPENKIKRRAYEKIYKKQRKKNDINYYLSCTLRERVRNAFKHYSKNGKMMESKQYGIDYKKIIEHLKPSPKNIENYDIDHIIPLSLWDLNYPEQIKKAFSPENHQWLTREINNWKGNRLIKPLSTKEKEKLQKQLEEVSE